MPSVSEPEVQFAQRLACNEKPMRRKALLKLRNYISARSRSQTGFSEEELLKLWKGLFYCLWMQDKLLLQEELSTQISNLVHHFHSFSAQLLYLQTFLTTVKREWTGIDRLRMDKFFQLVRFMFRQMFSVLQRSQWEPSCIKLFLELLSNAVLQTGAPPVGLQLHVLELYLRELAVVGSQELTADQNLVFIEPFCQTAAKTKDRSLFSAICNSIFSTIIDQAPFAIQELMDELQVEVSDSGLASGDPEETEKPERGLKSKKAQNKKTKVTEHLYGVKAHSDDDDDDDGEEDDEEDDGLSDSGRDEDVGPVLQFDYGALAEKLLELSKRRKTPSRNRQRLYKIIKVLRDLSQGSFPQDEYPEEVSTDEDDDFGSRKRIKRRHTEEEDELEPEMKKAKGKSKKTVAPTSEQNGEAKSEEVKKTKGKKKKKKPKSQTEPAEMENSEVTLQQQPEVQPRDQPEPSEQSLENGHTETAIKETKKKRKKTKKTEGKEEPDHSSTEHKLTSSTSETLPQTQEQSEGPVGHRQEEAVDTAQQKTSKKKNKKKCSPAEPGNDQEVTNDVEPEDMVPPEQDGKTQCQNNASEDIPDNRKDTTLQGSETPETNVKTPKKQKRERKKCASQPEPDTEVKTPKKWKTGKKSTSLSEPGEDVEMAKDLKKALEDVPITRQETPQGSEMMDTKVKTPKKRKTAGQKKNSPLLEPEENAGTESQNKALVKTHDMGKEEKLQDSETPETTVKTPKKQKTTEQKKNLSQLESEETGTEKNKKRKIPVEFEYEADEVQAGQATSVMPTEPQTPLSSKPQKIPKRQLAQSDFVRFQSSSPPAPVFCRVRGPHTKHAIKTKSATPKSDSKKVRFGLKNNQTAEFHKFDRSLLLSPDGTSRVPFDPEQRPKRGALKFSPMPFPKRKKKTSTPARTQKKKTGSVPARPTAADFF